MKPPRFATPEDDPAYSPGLTAHPVINAVPYVCDSPPGLLETRDPRVVERKKYGKAKARRSFQFSKR